MQQNSIDILDELFIRYPYLGICRDSIIKAFEEMKDSILHGGKILLCGNGGSAADCEHIVGELLKGFKMKREISSEQKEKLSVMFDNGKYIAEHLQGALPAVSLVNLISLNTAFINDVADDMVYAQSVYGLGCSNDILIVLTTSGNSKNILNAVKIAKFKGLKTIGFTGNSGGELLYLCDVCICVPETKTYLVQEYHLPVYHAICAMLESEFFSK